MTASTISGANARNFSSTHAAEQTDLMQRGPVFNGAAFLQLSNVAISLRAEPFSSG